MATDYLEKYIESVTDLPAQLQRKFRLIRDLDEKSAKLQVSSRRVQHAADHLHTHLACQCAAALSQPQLSPSAHTHANECPRRPMSVTSAASS
jgi:hypothetical protein